MNCTGLTTLYLDTVTEIGTTAFSGCTGLNRVSLGPGLTAIPRSAFEGCIGLVRMDIPEGVTEIDGRAFCGCSKLQFVRLPASLQTVDFEAFRDCANLFGQVYYNGTADQWSAVSIDDRNELLTNPDAIYYGIVERYGNGGAYYFQPLTGIVAGCDAGIYQLDNLPASIDGAAVTEIADWAFAYSNLWSITIPHGVTQIGAWTFSECSDLYRADIPPTVCQFGSGTFIGCIALESVYIPTLINPTFPYGVFMNCSSLTSAEIPYGITKIDSCASRAAKTWRSLGSRIPSRKSGSRH